MIRLIVLGVLIASVNIQANDLTQGRMYYLQNCMACHGQNGLGDGPASAAMKYTKPRNFVEEKFKYGSSFNQIMKTVENGIPGTPMPSWKFLPLQERSLIVKYIMSLKKQKN
jgi:cytochrome c oxidase cbb3-type subunit I/II